VPIYEYRCAECGEKFETLVFSSSEENVDCPACGGEQTEKLISMFASCGESSNGSSGSCGGGNSGFT
jgi:putative FmdB family regulatory protein